MNVICCQAAVMDEYKLKYQGNIRHEQIMATWDSFVIEDVVNSDGSPGGQNVLINVVFKKGESTSVWELLLPASYKNTIKQHPDAVTFYFEDFEFKITDAYFESMRDAYITLSVKKIEKTDQYSIDAKVVDNGKFENFFKTLKEVEGTWFCAETTDGGITGYDMMDHNGVKYHYRIHATAGGSRYTLTRAEL